MATIALVWELGADLGHLYRFREMARGLHARGHKPVAIVRDPAQADPILHDMHIDCYQAPIWTARVQGLPAPINLTETLLRGGFLDPRLAGLVRAWRSLLAAIKPDLLVFDLAPTAALAARGLGIPTLVSGTSYGMPPREVPLPPFDRRAKPPMQRLQDTESRVLRLCHEILDRLGAPRIHAVCELFDGDARLIAGFPELDVYGPRETETYSGPLTHLQGTCPVPWPKAGPKRVFAYLKPRFERFLPVLKALARTGASCLVAAPGVAPAQARQLSVANVVVHGVPLDMKQMCSEADLAISHAGVGMMDAMLGHGVPMLLLPTQWEQQLAAERAVAAGCASILPFKAQAAAIEKRILALLHDEDLVERTRAFSARHADGQALDRFVASCESLIRS